MGYPIASREKQFLDGSSKLVLTFEDKGDQMLVGDVPWRNPSAFYFIMHPEQDDRIVIASDYKEYVGGV
ncbi:hypothetical protein L6452_42063 [Arctium lappa]|uniref:Uncharacterized protein n=1 Tax=Arctium lappa TaxID=4217 RepID=A0ACB8XL96_ARCLA|nr:hypothetical protein L6452_42063 [Arctium lappa]